MNAVRRLGGRSLLIAVLLLLSILSFLPNASAVTATANNGIETFESDSACSASCTFSEPVSPAGSDITVNRPTEPWYVYTSASAGSGSSTLNVGVRALGLNSTTNAFQFSSGGTTGGQSARFTLNIPRVVTDIEVWAAPNLAAGGSYASCYFKMGSDTGVEQRLLAFTTDVRSLGAGGGTGSVITSTSARVNIIVDWAGKNIDYFKDGVHFAGPVSFTTSTNSGTHLSYLIARREGGNNCAMTIDEIKLRGGDSYQWHADLNTAALTNTPVDLEVTYDYEPSVYASDNINLGTDRVYRYTFALGGLGSTVYCDTTAGYHSRDSLVGFAYSTNRQLVMPCIQDSGVGTSFLLLDEDLHFNAVQDIIGIAQPDTQMDAGDLENIVYKSTAPAYADYNWLDNEVVQSFGGTANGLWVDPNNNHWYFATSSAISEYNGATLVATSAQAADAIAGHETLVFTSVFGVSSTFKQFTQFAGVLTNTATVNIPMDVDQIIESPDGNYLAVFDNQNKWVRILNSANLTTVVDFYMQDVSSATCAGINTGRFDVANNYFYVLCAGNKRVYRTDIFPYTTSTGGDGNATTPNPEPTPGTVPEPTDCLVGCGTGGSGSGLSGPAQSTGNPLGQMVNLINTSWGFDWSWIIGAVILTVILIPIVVATKGSPLVCGLIIVLCTVANIKLGLWPEWVILVMVFLIIALAANRMFAKREGDDAA